jgi:hypothetical protein
MEHFVPRFNTRQEALDWLNHIYYPSAHWRALSKKTRKNHPVCQECREALSTEVHHRTYDRLWQELPTDLSAVCHECHLEIESTKKAAKATEKKWAAKTKSKTKRKTPWHRKMLGLR